MNGIIFVIWILMNLGKYTTGLMLDSDENATPEISYRLDNKIVPSHYDIEIKTYLNENSIDRSKLFTFDGITEITISANVENVTSITLHAKNLNITETYFSLKYNEQKYLHNGKIFKASVSEPDEKTDKFTIELEDPLEINTDYLLKFVYSGTIGTSLTGLYRTNYTNENSELIWIASTHFEPNYAREAFPCFDEPTFKATFQLRINHENVYSSISNTKIFQTIMFENEDRSIDIFKPTPIMPAYSIAFVISDFKERRSNDGKLSIFSRTNAFNETAYALDIALQVLEKFDEYTGIPYYDMRGIEKLDLVAIPNFKSGAMENWGLITFKEKFLYYNDTDYSVLKQQSIALTICHEMAHMWFGNLVTSDWWSYSWMHEAFARYFEIMIYNEIFEKNRIFDQYLAFNIHSVMKIDSTSSTHPLTGRQIETPADVNKMFDTIIYSKGGAIIRMFFHTMGPQAFKIGIQNYLKENSYKSVKPEKLFSSFKKQWHNDKVNLTKLLIDWTEQPGYPLVTVHLSDDGRSLTVKQERYLSRKSVDNTTSNWIIPFSFTTNLEKDFQNTTPRIYLQNIEEHIELDHKVDWIIANIQQTGFYRVNYDEKLWKKIAVALKQENYSGIHEMNRAQIVNDLIAFGSDQILNYRLIYEILEFLENENENLPFLDLRFLGVNDKLIHEEKLLYNQHMLKLYTNIYEKLLFSNNPDDNPLDIATRNTVRYRACYYGHIGCLEKAQKYFDDLLNDNIPVPEDLQKDVYCVGVRELGDKYTDYLWNMYQTESNIKKKFEYLHYIGECTRDANTLAKVFDLVFTEMPIKDQSYTFTYAAGTDGKAETSFNIIRENFTHFMSLFEDQSIAIDKLTTVTNYLITEEKYKEVEEFYMQIQRELPEELSNTLRESLKTIENNIDWIQNNFQDFIGYIKENYANATEVTENYDE